MPLPPYRTAVTRARDGRHEIGSQGGAVNGRPTLSALWPRRSAGLPPGQRLEAGGALLRAGLVDEIQLLVLPAVVGGLGTPALFDGSQLLSGERPTSLRLHSSHADADGLLRARYEVLPERPAGRGADSRAAAANSSRLEADRA